MPATVTYQRHCSSRTAEGTLKPLTDPADYRCAAAEGRAIIRAGIHIIVTSLVVVLACVGLAFASGLSSPHQGTLRGRIEPSGHARLRIYYRHTHGQEMRWYTWHFYRVPLKCKGGPAVARDTVKGRQGIWNRFADRNPFGGVIAHLDKPHHVAYREHVSGKLITAKKARGFVRIWGPKVPVRGGGYKRCDSSRLHWKVTR